MASSSDVLPAPVGPVMANRSRAEKSSRAASRKLVNPASSSLTGRMSHLLVQFAEQGDQFTRRGGVVARAIEGGEEFGWFERRWQGRGRSWFLRAVADIDGVREAAAKLGGKTGQGVRRIECDAEEIIAGRCGEGPELIEGKGDVAQAAAGGERDAFHMRACAGACINEEDALGLAGLAEVKL